MSELSTQERRIVEIAVKSNLSASELLAEFMLHYQSFHTSSANREDIVLELSAKLRSALEEYMDMKGENVWTRDDQKHNFNFLSDVIGLDSRGNRGVDVGTVDPYSSLSAALTEAFNQAATGKGDERHADGKCFHEQPMQVLRDLYGDGFTLGQAAKKMEEQKRLGTVDARLNELRGAIVYLAGEIIAIKRENRIDIHDISK